MEAVQRLVTASSVVHVNFPRRFLGAGHSADGVTGVIDPLTLSRVEPDTPQHQLQTLQSSSFNVKAVHKHNNKR